MTDEQLLNAALAGSVESVSIYDLDATVRYINPATERITGARLADVVGKRLSDLYPDVVGNALHRAFERVAAGGEPEAFEHYYDRFESWYATRVVRMGEHVHVYTRDITEDVRRRRRLEALARISEVLTRDDLDRRGTAQAVAEILSDVLDAECTLALLSSDREWLEIVAQASRDPEVLAMFSTMRRWRSNVGHTAQALRTGSAVLAHAEAVARSTAAFEDATLRELAARYAPGSIAVVPLIVGDAPIGVLTVTRRRVRAPLTQPDATLLNEVGPSIGLYLALAGRRAEASTMRNRLAALADAIPALVSFVDRDERYQYVNAGYENWFGEPRERYLGRTTRDVLGEAAYTTVKPYVDHALAGTMVRFRTQIEYPSATRDVDVHYIPLPATDGSVEGFAALVQDVTSDVRVLDRERKQREAERRTTSRLETLLSVTGKLAGAARRDDVERVLVDAGFEALDASFAGMWSLSSDGKELTLVRERGTRADIAPCDQRLDMTAPGPLTECVRTGRSVFASLPQLTYGVLPLAIEGTVIGCVSFSFHAGRELTTEERTYLEVLALHGAEALRRAGIYAELRDVSETRAAMIQASPAAIMLLDENNVVHAWNTAAERIFHVSARDAVGRHLPGCDRQPDLGEMVKQVLAGEEVHGEEARRMRGNGEWFDGEYHAAPVTLSDGRTMCLAMVLDISERKRVERGRELIAAASAIFARSLDWHHTLSQVVRLPLAHIADWCGVDLVDDSGTTRRVAAPCDEPPGSSSFISVPLEIGERTLGALTLASSSRQFDDLDKSIASELANHAATAIENARLFEDARKARREAEDANRAKDEFLAMLGHELRNPLAPLVTALELWRMRAPDQLERERAVIERQVDHLGRLVDDLLDVSRITRGKIDLRRERVPLASVVAKAIEQTSPLFEQSRHRLSVDVATDLYVYGDPTRLAQIVANLLSNAAKYTPKDGAIEVHARRSNGHLELIVRDNGLGIPSEMLPRIFDLFVQAPQPRARTRGGLGLGLTIVRSLVELHGGTVLAQSAGAGAGSVFTITLPESFEPAAVNQPERVPQLPRAAVARRILVVDDNEDAAKLLAEVLVAHGHHIRTALDGPSALRVADEFQPEVAVLDIGLPVMDGYELAERMRATPNLNGVRLIAVTGYGQESDRARALDAGFHAHLAKPVAIETLVRLVDGPS